MKKIFFIRHGQSVMNVAELASGHTDTPLTPIGKEQATKAGKEARDKGLIFDVILASPLERAHHTAKLVAEHSGHSENLIELHDREVAMV